MKYINRLLWRADGQRINILAHAFFFLTLVFGLGFALFPVASGASLTVLYAETATHVGHYATSLWGIGALVVTAANTALVLTRRRFFSDIATVGGFSLWLYASVIYLMGGFWFQFLVACVPNLFFWTCYYVSVQRKEWQWKAVNK